MKKVSPSLRSRAVLFLAASLFALPAWSAEIAPENDQPEFILHTVKKGETMKQLAERHMGGAAYILELMSYNEITDPGSVSPGKTLAIPLAIRSKALSGITESKDALALALAAGADKFAPRFYQQATTSYKAATDAKSKAHYDQAIAMSRLAVARARFAGEEAANNAQIQEPAKITATSGTAELSTDGGNRWTAAKTGDAIPVDARLRCAADSRAEITNPDGSVFQILANSQIHLRDNLHDQRDGRRRWRLKVELGNILGEIEPRKNKKSDYKIDTDNASIAIRGTGLRVGGDGKDITTVAVLHGLTDVNTDQGRVEVPASFGTVAERGKAPTPAVQLLPPPDVVYPDAPSLQTAVQNVLFDWRDVESPRTGKYRIEIAQDKKFNSPFQSELVARSQWRSGVLPEGTWYYRITTLDKTALEGTPTQTGELVIKRNLGFQLLPTAPFVVAKGKNVLPPAAGINGKPILLPDSSIVAYESRTAADEPFQTMPEPLRLNEGTWQLEVRAVAADGTRSAPQTLLFTVDGTAPLVGTEVQEFIDPKTGLKQGRYTLEASDATGVQAIEHRTIKGEWSTYEGPITFDRRANLNIEYRAIDAVGNVSPVRSLKIQGELVRD